ncbi:hypothetical protein ES703_96668 [subsurface metagenome]
MRDKPGILNTVLTEGFITLMPISLVKNSIRPPKPIAQNMYEAPEPAFWPILTISAQATLSGKGRSVSSTKVRLTSMMRKTPKIPPTSISIEDFTKSNFVHTPVIRKAGIVNMAPAARASPTAPVVLAKFSSKIVPLNGRRTAIAITAAGKVAATVIPTIRPK